ncbi:hypothetical protein [Vreelandella nanhaiensis]|uniref:Uncharacterized protein n=1 Tax=Vreelandella nanhaiensis TaxID=1258546 RepID=A0A3S0YE82_9GAMM|nr:hypothetical protein [Halomonas nanhaiensis]RUR28073.1 hypothetical protein ELY38_16980 [Halomonas nanhaiensis]
MANQSQGAYTHTQISPSQIATALIGTKLIAYRVNRRPEQLSYLLGLVRMATALGHISSEDHSQLMIDLERLVVEEVPHV